MPWNWVSAWAVAHPDSNIYPTYLSRALETRGQVEIVRYDLSDSLFLPWPLYKIIAQTLFSSSTEEMLIFEIMWLRMKVK